MFFTGIQNDKSHQNNFTKKVVCVCMSKGEMDRVKQRKGLGVDRTFRRQRRKRRQEEIDEKIGEMWYCGVFGSLNKLGHNFSQQTYTHTAIRRQTHSNKQPIQGNAFWGKRGSQVSLGTIKLTNKKAGRGGGT